MKLAQLMIFVLPAIAAETAYQPVFVPQALLAGNPNAVRVSARIAGGVAANVQVNVVESGRLVPVGNLLDDGRAPDRKAGDRIFSGTVTLGLREPGVQTLRVTAQVNGRALASTDAVVESFPAGTPIVAMRGEARGTVNAVTPEGESAAVACDEINLMAPPGTSIERIRGSIRSFGGTIAGLDAYAVMNVWSIQVPCASSVAALDQAVRSLVSQGWAAETVAMGETNGVALTDPFMVVVFPDGTNHRQQIETPRIHVAWATTLGSAVSTPLVAVVDTGADFGHEDLQGRLVAGSNFGAGEPSDLGDVDGHGTMMAGLIAANAFNGIGVSGVAPEASVLVVKINRKGAISMNRASSGIRYAADHDASVINCSFGTPFYHQGLALAINYANLAGRLVVTAAGNFNGKVRYPAKFGDTTGLVHGPTVNTQTMTVGGYDRQGLHWSDAAHVGSAYGPELDIDAPAQGVITTRPLAVEFGGQFNKYLGGSGTSASSALVSGVAALVLSIRPEMSREDLFQLLVSTAVGTGGTHPDGRLIRGVDAWNAVFQAAAQGSCVGCPGTPEVSVLGARVQLASAKARSAAQSPAVHGAYLPLRPASSYQIRFHHNFNTFDTYASPLIFNSGFFDSFSISVNPQPYHLRPLVDPLTLGSLNAAILWGGSAPILLLTPQSNSGVGTIRTVFGQSGLSTQMLSIVLDTFSLPGRSSVLPSWGWVTIDDITPIP